MSPYPWRFRTAASPSSFVVRPCEATHLLLSKIPVSCNDKFNVPFTGAAKGSESYCTFGEKKKIWSVHGASPPLPGHRIFENPRKSTIYQQLAERDTYSIKKISLVRHPCAKSKEEAIGNPTSKRWRLPGTIPARFELSICDKRVLSVKMKIPARFQQLRILCPGSV